MNSELRTRFSFSEIAPERSRINTSDKLILVSLKCPGKKAVEKKNRRGSTTYLCFRISRRVLQQAGFSIGEKIAAEFDEGTIILRPSENGRKLHKDGTDTRYQVNYPIQADFINMFKDKIATKVQVEGDKIAFKLA